MLRFFGEGEAMPSIYDLKPRFQALLRPLAASLAKDGITANQVTVAAVVLSFAEGAAIYASRDPGYSRGALLLLPVVLFVRMALNAIDGMLAREHNMKSSLGGVLNELGDVISDAALYLPFAYIIGMPPGHVAWFVILGIVSEMTGVLSQAMGGGRRYDGPMGKSDRAFVMGSLGLLLGLGVPTGHWCDFLFAVLLIMQIVTIIRRAGYAIRAGNRAA